MIRKLQAVWCDWYMSGATDKMSATPRCALQRKRWDKQLPVAKRSGEGVLPALKGPTRNRPALSNGPLEKSNRQRWSQPSGKDELPPTHDRRMLLMSAESRALPLLSDDQQLVQSVRHRAPLRLSADDVGTMNALQLEQRDDSEFVRQILKRPKTNRVAAKNTPAKSTPKCSKNQVGERTDSGQPGVARAPDRAEFKKWKMEVKRQHRDAKRARDSVRGLQSSTDDPWSPEADPNRFRMENGQLVLKESEVRKPDEGMLHGQPKEMWFPGMENFDERKVVRINIADEASAARGVPMRSGRRHTKARRVLGMSGNTSGSDSHDGASSSRSHAESDGYHGQGPSMMDVDEQLAQELQRHVYLHDSNMLESSGPPEPLAPPQPIPAPANLGQAEMDNNRLRLPSLPTQRLSPEDVITPTSSENQSPHNGENQPPASGLGTSVVGRRPYMELTTRNMEDPHSAAANALCGRISRESASHNSDDDDEPFVPNDFSYENLLRLHNKNRSGNGLTLHDILKLPKVQLMRRDGDCAVCLEELRTHVAGLKLPCGHLYHGQCLGKWFEHHNECPVCRRPAKREDS